MPSITIISTGPSTNTAQVQIEYPFVDESLVFAPSLLMPDGYPGSQGDGAKGDMEERLHQTVVEMLNLMKKQEEEGRRRSNFI
jgi:hypothetical protein